MHGISGELLARLRDEHSFRGPIIPVYPVIPQDDSQRIEIKPVTISQVQQAVCSYFKISREELRGDFRVNRCVYPRHVGQYLACELTGRSSPFIGRMFGRDHSTILYARDKMRKRVLKDEDVAFDVALLIRELCGE